MSAPHLARLERRFLKLIAQPEPLPAAAQALECGDPGAARLSSWLRAESEETAAARLGIYAHMYFSRLHDSLREDFPHCARLLGPEVFGRLAARYLVRHPSDNPSLRYHGRHFPSFVRELLLQDNDLDLRADLADLCELEWARIEVFDAADRAVLNATQLAGLGPLDFAHLRLQSVPATRILGLDFAIDTLWSACDGERPPAPPNEAPQTLLVWRRGFRVYHRAVTGLEAPALQLLRGEGTRFADLCELFAEDGSLELAAERAASHLGQWLSDELLTRAPDALPYSGSLRPPSVVRGLSSQSASQRRG
jgi:hypothetical protein